MSKDDARSADPESLDELFARISDKDPWPKIDRLTTLSARVRDDVSPPEATFTGVPGWESFRIVIGFAVVDGKPSATSLRIEPLPDVEEPIPTARLRSLPVAVLVAKAFQMSETGPAAVKTLRAELRKAAQPTQQPHDPRASVTVAQVANVWNAAHAAGVAPRAAVVKTLGITERTADRYIKQAREAGEIPESPRLKAIQDRERLLAQRQRTVQQRGQQHRHEHQEGNRQ